MRPVVRPPSVELPAAIRTPLPPAAAEPDGSPSDLKEQLEYARIERQVASVNRGLYEVRLELEVIGQAQRWAQAHRCDQGDAGVAR